MVSPQTPLPSIPVMLGLSEVESRPGLARVMGHGVIIPQSVTVRYQDTEVYCHNHKRWNTVCVIVLIVRLRCKGVV